MRYDAHERLVAPARASSQPLLLLGGVVLMGLIFLALNLGYSILHSALIGRDAWETLAMELATGNTPRAVLINLFLFAFLIVALAAALHALHNRGLLSVIGPLPPALRQFRTTGLAVLTLYVVVSLLPAGDVMDTSANLGFGTWLMLLPLTLLALLIQTGAEELVFRGYLQSQLAARFPHPTVWLLGPSLLFALLHYDPAIHGQNTWLVVTWAALFGLATADLTARAGTLGPAIALHMINNLSAIAIAAPEGNFDGLALYTYPFSLDDTAALSAWAPVDFMTLFCSWLAARVALRR
ncbi:CPBP family intramembrane metalloprotease [Roseovarius sp. A21]|uniref:CPBP family intramembrane metalloprotease n=1 Tax=Roseovarius bejariae TaxID=2576383 RepID=A0A844CUY4_9RHOB|nr:CPBP family intramembrane glutamic endopeptidase [Roseovarius bejariae]MRU14996.1 CPBP family intramembrane metalloprotease [Roseovarius bejariae]